MYGDCFPAVGLIETPSDLPGAPPELSLYTYDNHWANRPAELRRYTLRLDGFVSHRATYRPKRLVTQPFLCPGGTLHLNFASSAAGGLRVQLHGPRGTLIAHGNCSGGDMVDRRSDDDYGRRLRRTIESVPS